MRVNVHIWLALIAGVTASACAVDSATDTEKSAKTRDKVFGYAELTNCSTEEYSAVAAGLNLGRVVVTTEEFAECMTMTKTENARPFSVQTGGGSTYMRDCRDTSLPCTWKTSYHPCTGGGWGVGDAFPDILGTIRLGRSANDMDISCPEDLTCEFFGGNNSACAPYSAYDGWTDSDEEWIEIKASYLNGLFPQLAAGTNPDATRMSAAGIIGGTLFHEVAHNRGFQHGGNDSNTQDSTCGYDALWRHAKRNAAPYLVARCLGKPYGMWEDDPSAEPAGPWILELLLGRLNILASPPITSVRRNW